MARVLPDVIDGSALPGVARLTGLTSLTLDCLGAWVNDCTLEPLLNLKQLRRLSLFPAALSNCAAAMLLTAMPKLEQLVAL